MWVLKATCLRSFLVKLCYNQHALIEQSLMTYSNRTVILISYLIEEWILVNQLSDVRMDECTVHTFISALKLSLLLILK